MSYPKVILNEECMREGMQIESADISVDDKINLLEMLSDTGLRNINVGSFVSPRYTPQMARIDEVLRGFTPRSGVHYYYLALNQKGVDRAQEFSHLWSSRPSSRAALNYSMSDTFRRRNVNTTRQQEIDQWTSIVAHATEHGTKEASIGINAAWGSNFEGLYTLEQRMNVLRRQHALWDEAGIAVTEVALGDPMGWNMPHAVTDQLEAVMSEWPHIRRFNLHIHNARGMAVASLFAALQVLDDRHELSTETSAGGIGGCAQTGMGRTNGMAPTEDVVHMLEAMGIPTGVDLGKLIDFVWELERVIGREAFGHVAHAGPFPDGDHLYDANLPLVLTDEEASHFRRGPGVIKNPIRPWSAPIPSPLTISEPTDPRRSDGGGA